MSEAALGVAGESLAGGGARLLFIRIAWRNLWRRKLRTWMSAAGISFAVLLVSFFMALQSGSYGAWIETSTGLLAGHLQLQHPEYFDDPRPSHAIPGGTELVRRFETAAHVVGVSPRVEAFALVSVGERSYGALVLGVDARREAASFGLPGHLIQGEYLPRADSAFVGAALAANLGIELGDEIVALGSPKEGGVAVLVLTVDGIFETGQPELDRSLLQADLTATQAAFEMGDSVHRVVIKTSDPGRVGEFKPAIEALLPAGIRLLDWRQLLPELEQAIELDKISAAMIYWLMMVVVAISVVNAFVMTVFERTREFGMLLAIGMRPNAVVGMLCIEAVCIWMIGAAIGVALCVAVVLPLGVIGISFAGVEGMEEMAARMGMPIRLYPTLSITALVQSPLVMLAGTLIAALIPALRVRKMRPVDALREDE